MIRWKIPFVLIGLLAAPAWVQAQTLPPAPYATLHYPTSQYPSTHYPSSPPTTTGQPNTPAEAAAQQQSGLSEADVRTLLQGEGYTRLNSIQADPGSLWVWQAEAIKNGHPVRVGIDYRGNVLVIAPEANRPCAGPGVNFGVGGLGPGARLSAVGSCRR